MAEQDLRCDLQRCSGSGSLRLLQLSERMQGVQVREVPDPVVVEAGCAGDGRWNDDDDDDDDDENIMVTSVVRFRHGLG